MFPFVGSLAGSMSQITMILRGTVALQFPGNRAFVPFQLFPYGSAAFSFTVEHINLISFSLA